MQPCEHVRFNVQSASKAICYRHFAAGIRWFVCCVGICVLQVTCLEATDNSMRDLTTLSLEDLMQIKVTIVSRKPETLSEAAAAVSIITSDDIQRSGATTLPEVLRLAPGVFAGQLDANKWAVSIRGFNNRFANKLLVLIDGRSVYSPLFSGTFWEAQDVLSEDVDRIEVIRGPGAALWGSNAVNGVINIITKSAQETQGNYIRVGLGTEERVQGTIRTGHSLGDAGYYRVYAKGFVRDAFVDSSGARVKDAGKGFRSGFRYDRATSSQQNLMLQGDIYAVETDEEVAVSSLEPPYAIPTEGQANLWGLSILGRWTQAVSRRSDLTVQTYYSWTAHEEGILLANSRFKEKRHTFDVDLNHHIKITARQEWMWGAGYRVTRDHMRNSLAIQMHPETRSLKLISGFTQYSLWLVPKRLRVEGGSKFEHNDLSGFEIQPSVRVWGSLVDQHAFWGAISRAVREPSRLEKNVTLSGPVVPPGTTIGQTLLPLPLQVTVRGNSDIEVETLWAYELGYRAQMAKNFTFDLAGFYNRYDHLWSTEPDSLQLLATARPPHIQLDAKIGNGRRGHTYGAEGALNWQPMRAWRLRGYYAYLQMVLETKEGSQDPTESLPGTGFAHHKASLLSSFALQSNANLDLTLRYVSHIVGQTVPAYINLNTRLTWMSQKGWTVSIVGQNLLHQSHAEFSTSDTVINTLSSQMQRGLYSTVSWAF